MLFGLALVSLASALSVSATPVVDVAKRSIPDTLYNDFVHYFKYASTSYNDTCTTPNGQVLVTKFEDAPSDTQGYVARDDSLKEIIVAFRGTSSQQDFTTDFDFELVPLVSTGVKPPTNTTVHQGFLKAYNSVASSVIASVKSELSAHAGYAVIIVGHSLGGGIASIAGVSAKANFGSSPIRVYTFGQPRTGNPTYAAYVDSLLGANIYRVVHAHDSVPTFVPKSLGFQHHGNEYWQNPDPASAASVTACTGDEDPTCSASIPSTEFINQDHLVYFNIFVFTSFC